MSAKTISLRDLRHHIKELDRLVTYAWFNASHPAELSFADVRKHAAAISAMVIEDTHSPHAATATKSPAAASDTDKADTQKRADYQRAAADKKPAFDMGSIWVREP